LIFSVASHICGAAQNRIGNAAFVLICTCTLGLVWCQNEFGKKCVHASMPKLCSQAVMNTHPDHSRLSIATPQDKSAQQGKRGRVNHAPYDDPLARQIVVKHPESDPYPKPAFPLRMSCSGR
jgi:hypothetical protein